MSDTPKKKRHVSDETRRKISEALKGKPMSEETRRKISAAHKGVPKPDSVKKKISEATKGIPRGPLSEETKAKMSAAHLGKKLSEEAKRKIGEAGRRKTVSEETKQKISRANKGRKRDDIQGGRHFNAKRINQYTMDGDLVRTWDCMREVTDDPQFASRRMVRECCQGKRESYKGYRWKYADSGDESGQDA